MENNNFDPYNESPFDYVDRKLLGFHEWLAEKWQDKTYQSKEILAKNVHGISALSFLYAYYEYSESLMPLVFGAFELAQYMIRDKRVENMLDSIDSKMDFFDGSEEIFNEFNSVVYPIAYAVSTIVSSYGLTNLAYGLSSSEVDLHNSVGFFLTGLGFFCLNTGGYFDRIDIEEPPKKPKKETLSERVGKLFDSLRSRKAYG